MLVLLLGLSSSTDCKQEYSCCCIRFGCRPVCIGWNIHYTLACLDPSAACLAHQQHPLEDLGGSSLPLVGTDGSSVSLVVKKTQPEATWDPIPRRHPLKANNTTLVSITRQVTLRNNAVEWTVQSTLQAPESLLQRVGQTSWSRGQTKQLVQHVQLMLDVIGQAKCSSCLTKNKRKTRPTTHLLYFLPRQNHQVFLYSCCQTSSLLCTFWALSALLGLWGQEAIWLWHCLKRNLLSMACAFFEWLTLGISNGCIHDFTVKTLVEPIHTTECKFAFEIEFFSSYKGH